MMAGINYSLKTGTLSPSELNSSSSACLPVEQVPWAFAVIVAPPQPALIQNISVKAAKAKAVAPVA